MRLLTKSVTCKLSYTKDLNFVTQPSMTDVEEPYAHLHLIF